MDDCLLSGHVPHPVRLFFHQGIYIYIFGGFSNQKEEFGRVIDSVSHTAEEEAVTAASKDAFTHSSFENK
jgi:hypothetical protein